MGNGRWVLGNGPPTSTNRQHPKPNNQHPKPKTQQPTPNTQHPKPNTQQPTPKTQNPKPNTQHPKPMEQQEDYTSKITDIFMRYGVKSVTMDDLSRELGISKKTLYQFFSDKEDLVRKVVTQMIAGQKCGIDQMLDQRGMNAIDHLLNMSRFIASHLKTLNPAMIYDLQKYYPKVWEEMVEFKQQNIFHYIMDNIRLGIEEGLYLDDINYEIIANAYVSRLEMYSRGEMKGLEKFSFDEIFNTLFIYHVRGISNNKGLRYLKKAGAGLMTG
jgi:TetR/AcrR family transcriptional regulator, cholesterol catabolism regulator